MSAVSAAERAYEARWGHAPERATLGELHEWQDRKAGYIAGYEVAEAASRGRTEALVNHHRQHHEADRACVDEYIHEQEHDDAALAQPGGRPQFPSPHATEPDEQGPS